MTALVLAGCGSPASVPEQLPRNVPEPPLWGFHAGLGIEVLPTAELVADIRRAKELGANTVRLIVSWRWLQPQAGPLNPERVATLDRLMEAARKAGLGVVAVPTFTPCWASTAPRGAGGRCYRGFPLYPPSDVDDYASFVDQVLTRWGGGLAGLEVWNEPNLAGFWRGTPDEYVELVRVASESVESSPYTDLPVVGGALAGSDLPYLRRLLVAGMADWTDAISIHPYDIRWRGPGFGDPSVARAGDMASFAYAVPQVHELLTASGDDDPIWITEFGYPTCPAVPHCAPPAVQADYLRKAADLAATWDYVDAFLVFRLRDGPVGSGVGARFGILNEDGTAKPAAKSLAEAFRALTR